MEKERNQELEKILTELNSSIKNPVPKEKEPAEPKREPAEPKGEPNESKGERKPPARKPNSRKESQASRRGSPERATSARNQNASGAAASKANLSEKKSDEKKSGEKSLVTEKSGNKSANKMVDGLAENETLEETAASNESLGSSEEKSEATREQNKAGSRGKESGEVRNGVTIRERLEETAEAAEDFFREEKSSFLETSRIIEEEMTERELRKPSVRHIAVTAAEYVDEKEAKEQTPKRKAFDQQITAEPPEPPEPPRFPKRTRKRMSKRERATAALGVLVTLFVVIGVVSTIIVGINVTKELVNSTAKKEELARVIFPLVIVDIPEFDNPESLDNAAIIQSAIWAFIIDDNDKSKYPKDDLGAMTVPETDIEPYIRRLYGNDVKIQHQSIDDASVQMLYDSENKRYIIESTPRFLPYTPRVDSIVKTGDIFALRVSYVLPDAMWNLQTDHSKATVDKVMEYQLKKNKDSYQMLSVSLLEVTGRSEQGAETSSQISVSEDQPLEEILSPNSDLTAGTVSAGSSSSDTTDSDSANMDSENSDAGSASDDADASGEAGTSSDEDATSDRSASDTSSDETDA